LQPSLRTRPLTDDDRAIIDTAFRELREHFHEWADDYESEHELIGFAVYEGFSGSEHCSAVMEKAAPFAVGKELVENDGFQWVMLEVNGDWHYAVLHPAIRTPIDLETLSTGMWIREPAHRPADPATRISESYKAISSLPGITSSKTLESDAALGVSEVRDQAP